MIWLRLMYTQYPCPCRSRSHGLILILKQPVHRASRIAHRASFVLRRASCTESAGLVVFDRVFIRGAVLGTIARAVVPGFKERIVKHEAGHFLLAYLMGCPVQGCVLDPFEVGRRRHGLAKSNQKVVTRGEQHNFLCFPLLDKWWMGYVGWSVGTWVLHSDRRVDGGWYCSSVHDS